MNLPNYEFLSAPLWLVTVLHILTLTLHFVAMNFLLGGVLITIFAAIRRRWDDPTLKKFSRMFPAAMAATITLGVAPLLFLQMVYHRQVYAAAIVSGWFWLLIIAVVIVAYYALYRCALKSERTGKISVAALVLALAGLIYVSLAYSSIFSMAERPNQIHALYAANQSGWVWNPATGDWVLRWLHMVLGAVTVGGFIVGMIGRDQPEAYALGFRMSSRGWAYQLEGFGLINKSQFDVVEDLINECKKTGLLPVDFTADEEGRQFSGVEIPDTTKSPEYFISRYLNAVLDCERYYTPDWWVGEDYYIQMLVEKIDLKTLFEPVCKKFHIPIATTKGWASVLQRATYGQRFKDAEERGMQCVLLYCGDHDPDGLRISENIRKNLDEVSNIWWSDGRRGYDPEDLIIDRFGLNYKFIIENNLTWIDNLETGSKKRLDDPGHKNHNFAYVQNYLKNYGVRKCEANALIVRPPQAAALCIEAIERYLGTGAEERFTGIRKDTDEKFNTARNVIGINEVVRKILPDLECWYYPWRSYEWVLP